MDISKYVDYFHDGGLYDIKHRNGKIELFMCSAEMDPEDLEDDISLSDNDRIKGILHLERVKKNFVNKNLNNGELKMEHQSGDIFDLEITTTTVILYVRITVNKTLSLSPLHVQG